MIFSLHYGSSKEIFVLIFLFYLFNDFKGLEDFTQTTLHMHKKNKIKRNNTKEYLYQKTVKNVSKIYKISMADIQVTVKIH